MSIFSKHWPFLANIIILWLITAILLIMDIRQNSGHLTYLLDDPYIHMTMAKNFAQHGIWSVSAHAFSSTSSSPLWTLLLAVTYMLFGVNGIAPFIINLLAASLLLFLAYRFMKNYVSNNLFNFIFLLLILWISPLPALIFSGQEHIIHIVIALSFMNAAIKVIEKSDESQGKVIASMNHRYEWFLVILAALLTSIRYEGLFMAFAVCLILILHKRPRLAILTGAASLAVPVIYGLISVYHGWSILPNPVLIKGNIPNFSSFYFGVNFAFQSLINLFKLDEMIILIMAALIIYAVRLYNEGRFNTGINAVLAIFLITSLLHLQFADIGWYYRYEAYLIAVGIFVVSLAIADFADSRNWLQSFKLKSPGILALIVLLIIIFYPLFMRGAYSTYYINQATGNIYNQQYQMGQFLKRYYHGQPVALNDIGAASFYGEIEPVDVWGLANRQIARAILNHNYSKEIVELTAGSSNAEIAIVYDNIGFTYNADVIPDSWIKIGWWKIPDNRVCYNDKVSFYAVLPEYAEALRRNFREFSQSLPSDVSWQLMQPDDSDIRNKQENPD